MTTFLGTVPLLLIVFAAHVSADETPRPEGVDFVRDVRPIFERACNSCHGPDRQRSGLRLDLKAEAFREGAYGPAIVPGDPEESPLLWFVSGEDEAMMMPPEGEPLSEAEVATLTEWISQGADWPDGVDRVSREDLRDHWSFRPLTTPVPPDPVDGDWARNAIDRFILDRLEMEGLRPSPEADRATWLRRVSFDLTGLPPTPERVSAFVSDPRPDAFERAVEELLASPRYGERWAQHWLDVVRYADTHGFEVNTERPNAWPYRDYVISAFNADTPYDRFVREQLAGDAIGRDEATGFLVTASVLLPGQIGKDEPSIRLARQDALDEIVTNAGLTFLGLSVGCARCHDHKFDPVSQVDYYAMQAFFSGVEYGDRPLQTPEAEEARREAARIQARLVEVDRMLSAYEPLSGSGVARAPINARRNVDRFDPVRARRLRFTILETNRLEPCIDEIEIFDERNRNIALGAEGTVARSSGDTVVANRHELPFINDGRFGNSRSWMSNEEGAGWVELEFPGAFTIDRVIWGRDREGEYDDRLAVSYRIEIATDSGGWQLVADSSDRREDGSDLARSSEDTSAGLDGEQHARREALQNERTALEGQLAAVSAEQVAFVGIFRTPDPIHRLHRGDPEQPREEVSPAVPLSLGAVGLTADAPEQERREVLASWIADPENPLTARVMVNRIWQGHFGRGIVETPSDFGRNGVEPSHPGLLDWLAAEFIRGGWSVKHLHRLIVLSSTYRQSNQIDSVARSKDASARLLWRFPSRRLEAEAIRDTMLTASGRLNPAMGGPGFDLFRFRGGLQGFPPVEMFEIDGRKRLIYAHKVRRERDAVFGAFDCPDAGQSTARRLESTTPIQALNLFNSPFTIDEAHALADRVRMEAGPGDEAQVRLAYQLALGREPEADELGEILPIVRSRGLPALCRALFNSNEFLHLP